MGFFSIHMHQNEKVFQPSFNKYGIRIGDIGVEFDHIKQRENFLKMLANSNSIKINEGQGLEFEDKTTSFGIYERNTKEVGYRCYVCEQVIRDGSCHKQEYEYPYTYGTDGFSSSTNYICNNCLANYTSQVDEIKKKNKAEKEALEVE